MNNDLNKLLNNLEPIIDKKCMELKKKKIQNIKMIILCISYVIIPIILLLFNISILYFIIITVIVMSLRFFIKLPDILKMNLEVRCYE